MNIIKNSKKILLPLLIGGLFATNVMADQHPVNLGSASNFTILTKTGITDVYPSVVTGSVGTSPITGAALLLECNEVVGDGKVFTVDAAGPLPCAVTDPSGLTGAIGAMEDAYRDAAGRTNPDTTEIGAGEIGGSTFAPGLHKWSSTVSISTDLTLDAGGVDDAVWIFQIAGDLLQASSRSVILARGAKAENIFWQVAGGVTIGTGASFQGVILSKTLIAVNTNASVKGRLFAQTAVTLQKNTVTP
ncbi:ice-binding family protein [Paraglaciecola sp. MB-3u-78]|jgi:hypothetical protein|uniref:ice-binding family protein n=1 Tax=Paraglaciecola sp. MB-3u-78 TaxID=2058332 RepID=UPI000C338252|nr:ice-binding family protein [Paraglaciecola sp. MB-3u-78]PKG99374.1 hypothetical protein CXF95_08990 [Paraglaciecola sp. MB-3u-78]